MTCFNSQILVLNHSRLNKGKQTQKDKYNIFIDKKICKNISPVKQYSVVIESQILAALSRAGMNGSGHQRPFSSDDNWPWFDKDGDLYICLKLHS